MVQARPITNFFSEIFIWFIFTIEGFTFVCPSFWMKRKFKYKCGQRRMFFLLLLYIQQKQAYKNILRCYPSFQIKWIPKCWKCRSEYILGWNISGKWPKHMSYISSKLSWFICFHSTLFCFLLFCCWKMQTLMCYLPVVSYGDD